LLIGLVPVLVLFEYTDSVHGWSQADLIVILGLQQVISGLLGMFVTRNMWEISDYITQGNLDLVLIRPVNTQFYVTTRWIRPDQLFNVLAGVVVAGIGIGRTGSMPGVEAFGQATIVLLCGFVLITCLWSAVAYCAFWMQSASSVTMFIQDVMQTGRYPVMFFPVAVRAILTFVVPVAFATTFPAQAITGGISWWLVAGAVLFATVAVAMLRLLWLYAVRFYSSASS
jgi:ABC-2 type transport system permease protein